MVQKILQVIYLWRIITVKLWSYYRIFKTNVAFVITNTTSYISNSTSWNGLYRNNEILVEHTEVHYTPVVY